MKSKLRELRDFGLRTETAYKLYLKCKWGVDKPLAHPNAPWRNAVLRTRKEWENALEQVKALGLPPHPDLSKNWDSLAALDFILKRTHRSAQILDAGSELYSVILPWLFLYGYRYLTGINLTFRMPVKRGSIHYEFGDMTQTKFKENTFDAITCLSVIEHGVNLEKYFREMSRILKPNGVLITSTDYGYPVATQGKMAYGSPIHIFSQNEIITALNIAKRYDLELTDNISLDCKGKTVKWNDLEYTFIIFTLQKNKTSGQCLLSSDNVINNYKMSLQ